MDDEYRGYTEVSCTFPHEVLDPEYYDPEYPAVDSCPRCGAAV